MRRTPAQAGILKFATYEVDRASGELYKSGVRQKLTGQHFEVLCQLLEHPHEVITREEFQERIWSKDTFVDYDVALRKAITHLRELLGDSAENPRFIETIPRKGYRFIAAVESNGQATAGRIGSLGFEQVAGSENSADVVTPSVITTEKRNKRAIWIFGLGSLCVIAGALALWRIARSRPQRLPPIEVTPLLASADSAAFAEFSPDGNFVAFTGYDGHKNSGIYVAQVGGQKKVRLTSNTGDGFPAWSPDGSQIAFNRYETTSAGDSCSDYVVPSLGGPEHSLAAINAVCAGLSWSPDGKLIAFPQGYPGQSWSHAWIALLSVADGTIRRLTSPREEEFDGFAKFSPDGSKIAFVRGRVAGVVQDLYIVASSGGPPKRITFDNSGIVGFAWTGDGREVVFSSWRGPNLGLWRLPASGGTPQPVAGVGFAWNPSIAPRRNLLLFETGVKSKEQVLRLDLKDETHRKTSPTPVISENSLNARPDFSPDGKKIALESDRLGHSDIWTCDVDGSNCLQVTSLHNTTGAARWSPDGKFLAFECHPSEHSEIAVLQPGAEPKIIPTLPGADNGAPSWSRDGRWIYFYSKHGGKPFQLWKVRVAGGSPVQVTKDGGVHGVESTDGRFLYFSKAEKPGIWRMPLNGGEEVRVVDEPIGFEWYNWALVEEGIYFFDSAPGPNGAIAFFSFKHQRKVPVWSLNHPNFMGLTVAPDRKSLLYVEIQPSESSLVLVKNFQ